MTPPPPNHDPLLREARDLLTSSRPEPALARLSALPRTVLRTDPRAFDLLTRALLELNRWDDAVKAAKDFLAKNPRSTEARCRLAIALQRLGRLHDCMTECRAVLAHEPENGLALLLLADAAVHAHATTGLVETIAPLVERERADPRLRLAFARVCEAEHDDSRALAAFESLVHDDDAPTDARRAACFHLGRILDNRGEHSRAFETVAEGNALIPRNFDRDSHRAFIDSLISSITRESIAAQPSSGVASELPVFVVGMPRSGTTLVAHILGSHPRVVSLGERADIHSIHERLSREAAAPDAAQRIPAALRWAAGDYISLLKRLAPSAARTIDKNPFNFQALSLVQRLLPRARVIHCVRNPIDTCVSCYFQYFAYPSDFTCDFEDLAAYYAGYKRLMEHWESVLDLRMTRVVYRDLVHNTEPEARRLVDFLGLDWDDACLRHHELNQPALTASHEQVRKPVYTSSVGRWKRYQPHVEPLLAALRGNGLID